MIYQCIWTNNPTIVLVYISLFFHICAMKEAFPYHTYFIKNNCRLRWFASCQWRGYVHWINVSKVWFGGDIHVWWRLLWSKWGHISICYLQFPGSLLEHASNLYTRYTRILASRGRQEVNSPVFFTFNSFTSDWQLLHWFCCLFDNLTKSTFTHG